MCRNWEWKKWNWKLKNFIDGLMFFAIHLFAWIVRVRFCSTRNGCSSPGKPVAASRTSDRSSVRGPSTRMVFHCLANRLDRFHHHRMSQHCRHQLVLYGDRMAATGKALLRESQQSSTRHQHSDRQRQWNENRMPVSRLNWPMFS